MKLRKNERERFINRKWNNEDSNNMMHLEIKLKSKEQLINMYAMLSSVADLQIIIKNDIVDLVFKASRLHEVRQAIDAR